MATPRPVPISPRVPAELAAVDEVALVSDVHWEALAVTADFSGQVAEDIEVSGCRLRSASFSGAQLVRTRLSDTVFERCDLSATVLSQAVLARVELNDCRLSGADLSGARLEDVLFRECRLVDVNLRIAVGARVRFEGCTLAGADLYAAQLQGAWFFDSDLIGAELSQANLGRRPAARLDPQCRKRHCRPSGHDGQLRPGHGRGPSGIRGAGDHHR